MAKTKCATHKFGICKLTGNKGKFVKSHIIPKAFTRSYKKGEAFVQGGVGHERLIKRWDSWYDDHLVIRKGEDILSELDDFAVKEFTKHHMVWRSWGNHVRLADIPDIPDLLRIDMDNNEALGVPFVRIVKGINPIQLRLFCLSLLWRAAASDLFEMSEIELPKEELEFLRNLLINKDPGPVNFYPASIVQLSTMGENHNFTPIVAKRDSEYLHPLDKGKIFRFYMDGLIFRFYCGVHDESDVTSLQNTIIGYSDRLDFVLVDYYSSFQKENLEKTQRMYYK